ncbi:hypothetical protein [Spirosoma telluris]|uniref:hypothetical protein n=1 Tax=Spirosoma telluris TaxID=2183553 RepID=UPI002FC2F932
MLTGGWLLWLASTKPTPTPTQKADIQIKVVDWQTRRFQLDSTTASQIDTIWWDFGDSTRFGIAEAGSVVHTYRQVGDYRIKASWRNNSVLDSTTVMTKIIDADSCRLDFDVVSKGDSYTFINQSPGLKAGFAYQFSFGDGSKPVVSKRNFITHTYASDTAQYSVMLTALVANCQNRATQYIGKASFSPVSAGLRRMADKRVSVQVMMAWWLPFLLIGSTATVAGLVLVNWFRGSNALRHSTPSHLLRLVFPTRVRVSESGLRWTTGPGSFNNVMKVVGGCWMYQRPCWQRPAGAAIQSFSTSA